MSIDLYFAGSSMKEADELILSKNYNRLFSYLNDKSNVQYYIKFMKDKCEKKIKLFIDSGAFTAWTNRKTN